MLYQAISALHTQRLNTQPTTIFLGNLAGSIIGILGVIRFVMKYFEKNYEHIMREKNRKITSNRIIQNAIRIISKNFDIFYTRVLHRNRNANSSRDFINTECQFNREYTHSRRAEDPMRLQVEALPTP